MSKSNPRRANGNLRNKIRARIKARGDVCALCGMPIDYNLPAGDPWSYEVDEIIPVSRGGDPLDINNCQPAHRICNQRKGNGARARVPLPAAEEESIECLGDW